MQFEALFDRTLNVAYTTIIKGVCSCEVELDRDKFVANAKKALAHIIPVVGIVYHANMIDDILRGRTGRFNSQYKRRI